MDPFLPGQSNHLEIYIHLLTSACPMVAGFHICLASHSCEGLIPSTALSNVSLAMGFACPSLSSPSRRESATAGVHAGENEHTSSRHCLISKTQSRAECSDASGQLQIFANLSSIIREMALFPKESSSIEASLQCTSKKYTLASLCKIGGS